MKPGRMNGTVIQKIRKCQSAISETAMKLSCIKGKHTGKTVFRDTVSNLTPKRLISQGRVLEGTCEFIICRIVSSVSGKPHHDPVQGRRILNGSQTRVQMDGVHVIVKNQRNHEIDQTDTQHISACFLPFFLKKKRQYNSNHHDADSRFDKNADRGSKSRQ